LAAASRELGVNQSTVYRRIGQLEANLDARLFDRQPRGYSLTAVGEDMLAHALRIEDDVLALDRNVLGADRELRGTVRITTVDEVLERVAPHFKCFCDRYPAIDLEVNSEQRLFSLSNREADVAIRPGRPPTEPDIVGRKLVALQTAAYASPKYLSERKLPRRTSDLGKHCLISLNKGHWLEQMLRDLVGEARVVYRANSMNGQAIAARAGLGIAFLPTFMGDPDAGLERLFVVPLIEDDYLWLLIHADLRQTARVRAFVDFVTEAILDERALYEGTSERR
jgi:DNA-binding transcriptional LysR family regulator